MKAPAILQSAVQNILQGALITSSVSPEMGYSLETLGFLRPDMRVVFGNDTVTIEFQLGGGSPGVPAQGDILVIPFSNLRSDGSPGSLRLTNDQGLDQNLDPPGLLANGLPQTLVVDLTVETSDPMDRTAATWQLVISDNVADVVLGGAIAIYGPKTYLVDRDFRWDYQEWDQGSALDAVNDYQTLFRQNLGTMIRGVDVSALATDADLIILRDAFRGCIGHARPGLLWFDPDIQDAFLGYFQPRFSTRKVSTDANAIDLTFTELSKGRPL